MPIYEYNCRDCKKTFSILFLSISEADSEEALCPECGKKNLERLVSGVSVIKGSSKPGKNQPVKSEKTSSNDPTSLAQTMNKESSKSGRDYGDDFKEVKHRLEKGENPDSIEKTLRKRVGEEMGVH